MTQRQLDMVKLGQAIIAIGALAGVLLQAIKSSGLEERLATVQARADSLATVGMVKREVRRLEDRMDGISKAVANARRMGRRAAADTTQHRPGLARRVWDGLWPFG